MRIEIATSPAEREAVFRQRYSIYVEEMHLYHSWADHEHKRLVDEDDSTGRLLYAEEHGVVVASLRVHMGHDNRLPESMGKALKLHSFESFVAPDRMCVTSRFTIDRAYRRSPLSFRLVAASYEMGCREGAAIAFLDCLPHLIPLYSRLGFRRYGDEIVDEEVGILSPMCLVMDDTAYLKATRSPLLPIALKYFPADHSPNWIGRCFVGSAQGSGISAEESWAETFGTLSGIHQGRHRAFSGFSSEDLKPIISRGQIIDCKAGDLLIKAGTLYENIYIILSGTCEIRVAGRVIGLASDGDLIGEMAYLLNASRTADVLARSNQVRVLSLSLKDTRRLMDIEPRITSKFLLNLSRILAERLLALRELVFAESRDAL